MAISVQGAGSIQNNIKKSTNSLREANEELSSGKKNPLKNAAPAAIAAILAGEATGAGQASRNISDAVSVANVADGGLEQAGSILQRQQELAVQASNGTLTAEQRGALDQEYQQLNQELDRISQTTTFNGQNLLSGSGSSFAIQVGNDGSSSSQINLSTPGVSSANLNTSGSNLLSAAAAQSAIDVTKNAIDTVSSARGNLGAEVSRLEAANNQVQTARVNFESARSELEDVDYIEALSKRTASEILQQAGVAALAHANTSSNTVLKLLS